MRGLRLLSDTAVNDVFNINLLDAIFLEHKLGQSSNHQLHTTLRTRVLRHRAHIIYFYHRKSTQCQKLNSAGRGVKKIPFLVQRTFVMGDILDLNFSSSVASNVI